MSSNRDEKIDAMKVLILSGSDSKGGAAKVALDLGRGLRASGHEAELHCGDRHIDESWIHALPDGWLGTQRIASELVNRLGIPSTHFHETFPKSAGKAFFERFDLIHLHDPPGFNFASLAWLSAIRPVVWTLHNQAAFTGNCIFSYDCERWKQNCGECPEFGKFPLNWIVRDGSGLAIRLKRQVFAKAQIDVVAVSDWLYQQLPDSILGGQRHHLVHNSADTSAFHPIDQRRAREKMGVPLDAQVVIASLASDPMDRRKGMDAILKCLQAERDRGSNWFLIPLGIGPGADTMSGELEGIPHLAPQHLDTDEALNVAFNAADVGWHPSLADNAPLSILEMMAAGLPVVASRVGGVPEMIETGVDGVLIDPDDAGQLGEATRDLLADDSGRQEMGEAARERVLDNFSREAFVQNHIDLFEGILDRQKTSEIA